MKWRILIVHYIKKKKQGGCVEKKDRALSILFIFARKGGRKGGKEKIGVQVKAKKDESKKATKERAWEKFSTVKKKSVEVLKKKYSLSQDICTLKHFLEEIHE